MDNIKSAQSEIREFIAQFNCTLELVNGSEYKVVCDGKNTGVVLLFTVTEFNEQYIISFIETVFSTESFFEIGLYEFLSKYSGTSDLLPCQNHRRKSRHNQRLKSSH